MNESRPESERTKVCNGCFEEKLIIDFYPKTGKPGKVGKNQRVGRCKECDLKNHLDRKDSIAKSEYDRRRYLKIKDDKKVSILFIFIYGFSCGFNFVH